MNNAISCEKNIVLAGANWVYYIYLLADIAELLPLGTVQVGEHVQEAARVQHLAVVAVVGGQDAAVDLTVARII